MFYTFSKLSNKEARLFFIGIGGALAGFGAAIASLDFYNAQQVREHGSTVQDLWIFYGAAALASFLIGPLFWWCLVLRPNRLTLLRGILVGVVSSIVVHPLAWFFADLIAYFLGKQMIGGLFLVQSPLVALFGAPILAVFSLLFVGWITVLIGGGTGGALFCAQRACDRINTSLGNWRSVDE